MAFFAENGKNRRSRSIQRAAFPEGKMDFSPEAKKTDEGEITLSSRLVPCHCTLAVPKIFCGIRLEYFDRGAKPCSLFRPLGALRRLCSQGEVFNAPVIYKNFSLFYGRPHRAAPTTFFVKCAEFCKKIPRSRLFRAAARRINIILWWAQEKQRAEYCAKCRKSLRRQ